MNRGRPVIAALAALASLGVALPLNVLFSRSTWSPPALLLVIVVAVVGIGARRLLRPAVAIVSVQLLAVALTASFVLLRETTWHGLPTAATAAALRSAVEATGVAISEQAAPVDTTPQVALTLALAVALIALAVDLLAATLRMPAAAGFPLLAAYAAAAANTGSGLGLSYFVVPAAAWVGLLGHDGVERIRRWGTSVARPRGGVPPDLAPGLLARARALALAALAVALVLPTVIPHLPTTFIADGLGRGGQGNGDGVGNRLEDTLAVARNLGDRSTDPVLRYTTDDIAPPPLRVDTLVSYENGEWRSTSGATFDTQGQLPASPADPEVPRRARTTRVTDNELLRPQLALPGTPVSLDLEAATWRVDANGNIRAMARVSEYTVGYEEPLPTPAQLRASNPFSAGDAASLAIDGESSEYVRAVLAEVAPDDLGAAEAAWRIQAFLRSARFTYALDLADPVTSDEQGRTVPADPLSQFLATRRGYCVQFSTAMAMMARHRGIPARVAIGFLPGRLDRDEWVVRAADAHAWPELLFPGIGWVRFEPTPSTRSGSAPTWTSNTPSTAPSATVSAPTRSESAEPTEDATTGPDPASSGARGVFARVGRWILAHRGELLLGVGALLALSATPVAGLLRRRRALRRARDDAERTEVLWSSLLDRLETIGVRPGDGDTPRQARVTLGRQAHLDEAAAADLTSVVATLERARYAPPGPALEDIGPATDRIASSALAKRRWSHRLRARLWPVEGQRAWLDAARTARRLFRRGDRP